MKKFTKKNLLNHLNRSGKEDLILEIVTLFEKFENVKEFYKTELSDADNPVLEIYKKKISKAYVGSRPKERTTNMNLNKLITAFLKVSVFKSELIDLLLYRVECGIGAIIKNRDRSETFYRSITGSLEDAVRIMIEENSVTEYRDRVSTIALKSRGGKFGMEASVNKIISLL